MLEHRTIDLKCPKCGATMEWKEFEHLKMCKYCGYVEKDIDGRDLDRIELAERMKASKRQEAQNKRDEKQSTIILIGIVIFLLIFVALPVFIRECASLFR